MLLQTAMSEATWANLFICLPDHFFLLVPMAEYPGPALFKNKKRKRKRTVSNRGILNLQSTTTTKKT